jgi:hypothetical protein
VKGRDFFLKRESFFSVKMELFFYELMDKQNLGRRILTEWS